MRNPIFSFLMEVIGAFIVWASKGFKGKFDDEMSNPYEISKKSWRNTLISIVFVLIVLAIINKTNENKKENIHNNKYEIVIKR